jgi:hypothetical protein
MNRRVTCTFGHCPVLGRWRHLNLHCQIGQPDQPIDFRPLAGSYRRMRAGILLIGWGLAWCIMLACLMSFGAFGLPGAALGWLVGALASAEHAGRESERFLFVMRRWAFACVVFVVARTALVTIFEGAHIGPMASFGFLGLVVAAALAGGIGGSAERLQDTQTRRINWLAAATWGASFGAASYAAIVLRLYLSSFFLHTDGRDRPFLGWALAGFVAGAASAFLGNYGYSLLKRGGSRFRRLAS